MYGILSSKAMTNGIEVFWSIFFLYFDQNKNNYKINFLIIDREIWAPQWNCSI